MQKGTKHSDAAKQATSEGLKRSWASGDRGRPNMKSFTVKTPMPLWQRVRDTAHALNCTIQSLVARAIVEFLDRVGEGR